MSPFDNNVSMFSVLDVNVFAHDGQVVPGEDSVITARKVVSLSGIENVFSGEQPFARDANFWCEGTSRRLSSKPKGNTRSGSNPAKGNDPALYSDDSLDEDTKERKRDSDSKVIDRFNHNIFANETCFAKSEETEKCAQRTRVSLDEPREQSEDYSSDSEGSEESENEAEGANYWFIAECDKMVQFYSIAQIDDATTSRVSSIVLRGLSFALAEKDRFTDALRKCENLRSLNLIDCNFDHAALLGNDFPNLKVEVINLSEF